MSLPRYIAELVSYAKRATEALERQAAATELLARLEFIAANPDLDSDDEETVICDRLMGELDKLAERRP